MNNTLNKIARIISQLSQPPLIIGLFITYLVFHYAPDTATGFLWLLIAGGLIGAVPTIFTFIAVKQGWIQDVLLSRREDRTGPMLIAAFGAIVTLITFYKMGVPADILVFLMALILVLTVIIFITLFWKISVHAATITVVTITINMLTGGEFWYLLLLIPIVAWSRVYRKKHSIAQVIAGVLTGGVIVYSIFELFGF